MTLRLCLLSIITLPAIFAEAPLRLSLRQAIEIALSAEGNATIQLAGETVKQAEARSLQNRASLLPQLGSAVSYQDITGDLAAFGIRLPAIPGLQLSSFTGPFSVLDVRTSVTQSVVDISAIRRFQSTRASMHAVRREGDNARNGVENEVARAYLVALQADALLEAARANLRLSEALRQLAETQKSVGTGTGIDVVRAEVQIAGERQRLQIAENARTRARLQLARILDLNLDTELDLTDALSYQPVEPIGIEQALESAIKTRPDLKAQEARERTARLNFAATKTERLPSITVFGDYGTIGARLGDSRPTRTVGLSLRIPIFDGGRLDARRAESASLWRQERIRTKDLRQQLELELRVAFDNLKSAELQVITASEGLTLAEKELQQAERRYRAGVADSIEVTDAQTRLVHARSNRISALYQHKLARLDLGTAMGAVDRYLP